VDITVDEVIVNSNIGSHTPCFSLDSAAVFLCSFFLYCKAAVGGGGGGGCSWQLDNLQ
jgi:hypothetical protein